MPARLRRRPPLPWRCTEQWLCACILRAGIARCVERWPAYRDIKLENTLLERVQPGRNPLIKICDFGYSIDDQSSLPKTKVGTPGYTGETAGLSQGCFSKNAEW